MSDASHPGRPGKDEYEGMVAELMTLYDRPFKRLLLAGVVIYLAFGLRDVAVYGDAAGTLLAVRAVAGAALLMLALLARRFHGEAMLWIGVIYLAAFAVGLAATTALSPNRWVMHALSAFSMLIVAFGPLWPRWRYFLAGTAMLLLSPLVMLVAVEAPAATWVDYLAYLSVAVVVSWLLFRLSQWVAMRSHRLRRELYSRATSDALTGVLNRAGWGGRAEHLLDSARESGIPVVLLYLDLDHFKQVNDRYGHAAGDEVLERAALAIRTTLRGQDLVARLGGEEFVVLLPGVNLEQARAVAERIRQRVADANTSMAITLSGGLAEWDRAETLDDLMHRADLAMIEAKRNGRNRVMLAA